MKEINKFKMYNVLVCDSKNSYNTLTEIRIIACSKEEAEGESISICINKNKNIPYDWANAREIDTTDTNEEGEDNE